MASTYTFNTPAKQGPLDAKTAGMSQQTAEAFYALWNANLAAWTQMSIIGNPWSNVNDAPRSRYFNPVQTGWPAQNPTPIRPWTAFPNRLPTYFADPRITDLKQLAAPLSWNQILALADSGQVVVQGGEAWKLFDPTSDSDVLKIPSNVCPNIDWTGKTKTFSPAGPRGWLDEYCEWAVTCTDASRKTIQSVTYTCENPAYWLTLWQVDPNAVCALYQKYIDPAVQLSELYLTYPKDNEYGKVGDPVIDPTTGRAAYDPTNRWNRGTIHLPGQSGGAMHLSSPPNTLSAEIYLAAAATIMRNNIQGVPDPQALICCSQYGQSFRNSNPSIGAQSYYSAESNLITLADPVGLYLQQPNYDNIKVDGEPDSSKFFQVTRGFAGKGDQPASDYILQLVFTPPPGKKVTVLNPQSGNWEPFQYAGQIALNMQVTLRIFTEAPGQNPPPHTPVSCVTDQPAASLQPWPVQFVPLQLALASSPTDLPLELPANSTTRCVLTVQGASSNTTKQNARVGFDTGNVKAAVVDYWPQGTPTPGQTSGGGTQAYVIDVTVAAGTPAGSVGVRALNPYEAADPSPADHPFAYGLFVIGGAGAV